MLVGYWRSG